MATNTLTKDASVSAHPTYPEGVRHFQDCMKRSTKLVWPYDYWLLSDVLPGTMCDDIANLPFPPPEAPLFNGRREANNSKRVYFSAENQEKFPVCRDTVAIFSDPSIIALLEKTTQSQISKGHLRIEYCQDVDGFWLEPHLDIKVKLFTMLVYLSDDPKLFDAGTDVYDSSPEHKLVTTAPYEKNTGMIFIPGTNTWHGFSKRPIKGLRKSIIINYVAPEWINKAELAYQ